MEINKQQMTMWYFALAFLAVVFLQDMFAAGRHTETLAYSEFKALLHAGKVSDVVVTDTAITGRLSTSSLQGLLPAERLTAISAMTGEENYFATVKVDDPGLVTDLEAAKVRFSGKIESRLLSTVLSWVVPMLLFFALWSFLAKRMGGAQGLLSIGKSKAKVYMEKQTGVSFDDVAGIDEAKAELVEVVEFLKTPDRYRRLGGKIPKGVMLVGAPGTGKTLLAKAVAGEAGVPFFSMSGSGFVEMFVGVGAARVRDLFDQAQKMAPCIIFIDELDALGKARGMGMMGGHDEREQTLNQLLVEMDGFDTNKGVIIMAATNRPEVLDPALLRPGRFDRHVVLDPPDLRGREQILRVHVKDVKLAPSVDLGALAARTPGFAGADLANLVNEAALRAARKDKDAVDMTDFDEATDRIVGGLEKRQRVMNPAEKETVAYHEAGHALVAESRPHADKVAKISIIPRGIAALGYTQQQPTEDRYLLRRGELLERLDVLLGGRVAEEIVFGDVSTGAQNDLQRATDLARHMVTRYGMSERLGLASYEDRQGTPFLNLSMSSGSKEYSEGTAHAIDEEVTKLLADAQTRVRETLTARRPALETLAKMLLEKETIDRVALDQVLAGHTAPTNDRPGAVVQPARNTVVEEPALAATKEQRS